MNPHKLTFTRFVAAAAVVFYHYGRDLSWLSNSVANFMVQQANLAVSYFFALSGFVMVVAYRDFSF